MKKFTLIFCLLICSLTQLFAVAVADDTVSGVDRFAIYIGCNYGGKGRERLLYAGSDAKSFKIAMSEIGGVTENNSRILIDPNKEAVDKALDEISAAIKETSGNSKRSEFIFYYSGHSDENALLLGDAKYDYSTLKAAISAVPSDIHVVILDSCYSGNFIRTKGGQKRKPFLIDDSSVVTGHAYLSSSSDNESSQESDEIESSYFTNAMITGLRGAADTSGDNKVTLNELYSYAFSDTLSKTESSKAGPQHPNYNITLVGSGDLILSDLTTAESMLSLSKDAKGRFIIRDANDKLISEINKVQGQPIFMALPSGQYSALIIDEYSTKQGTFILEKDQVYVLDQNSLSSIKRKTNRLRGEKSEKVSKYTEDEDDYLTLDDLEETKEKKYEPKIEDNDIDDETLDFNEDFEEDLGIDDLPVSNEKKERASFDYVSTAPIKLMFVPGVSFVNGEHESSIFTFGIIGSNIKDSGAVQASSIFNLSSGNIFGIQAAGIFNISNGQNNGVQVAGLFNIGNDVAGAQVAGLFNLSQYIGGTQVAGFMNIAKDSYGSQIAGFANIAKNHDGIQIAGFMNTANEINGMQLSGGINIANKINGAQIGIANIADENEGITIGLFNYVENGLHDVSMSIDTDGFVDFFYQGGAKHLFTTFGASYISDEVFDDSDFGIFYIGVGTEFSFPYTSLDLEFLWKTVYNDNLKEDLKKLNYKTIEEQFGAVSIPCAKITWNFWESSFLRIFIATSFDINVPGWNDYAFDFVDKQWVIDSDDFYISPTFSFGIKLKI